jgi:hypothetical protein
VKRLLVAGVLVLGYLLLNRLWKINRQMMVENAEGLGELLPH